MRDRETELHYYPKDMLSLQGVTRVLCIAPHPDDEVFGCAGAMMVMAKQGAKVQSIVVTQGDKALGTASQDHATERAQESRQAAQLMGCQPPIFLDFEDRQLSYGVALIGAISSQLKTHFEPDTAGILFLPSLSEPHPDHQAVALAGLAAAQSWTGPLRVLFYEVGAPMHPNTYLDITGVAEQKWQAVAQFTSQLGLENYAQLCRAMATLRAFGKAPGCTAAEAYFEVDMAAIRRAGPLAALPQWPWVRTRLQLANSPQDLPLVSVLIRSMDRPSLAETLACVAQQTYPHIEIVLVNASGRPHTALTFLPEQLTVQMVRADGQGGLGRSGAANEALAQARGSLALFLDDDDLIAPDHLQRLVQVLHEQGRAVAAYSGVRVVNQDGQTVRDYDLPWHNERLKGINFLPIHAVLFRMREVRERHLSFDTTLPVLEDWDFWRQLSQNQPFVHSPGVTATYRQSLGQSGLSDPRHENHWQAWHLELLNRYLAQCDLQDTAKCLAWHAIELDKISCQFDQQQQQQRLTQQQLEQTRGLLQREKEQSKQHQAARDQLQYELETYSAQVRAQAAEREARLHSFAAESNKALADKEQALQNFSIETQKVLADKEQALQNFSIETQKVLADKAQQLQQLSQELHLAQEQVQLLKAWTHKITRWLPGFLHPQKNHL
jgi:LmbE family N-acetylglucosaminyl deacetylase